MVFLRALGGAKKKRPLFIWGNCILDIYDGNCLYIFVCASLNNNLQRIVFSLLTNPWTMGHGCHPVSEPWAAIPAKNPSGKSTPSYADLVRVKVDVTEPRAFKHYNAHDKRRAYYQTSTYMLTIMMRSFRKHFVLIAKNLIGSSQHFGQGWVQKVCNTKSNNYNDDDRGLYSSLFQYKWTYPIFRPISVCPIL